MAPLLHNYFRMDDDIEAIYAEISRRDPKVAELVTQYRGMRILRQEPWECLVAYICSRQSPIKRIIQNSESLAEKFEDPIFLGGETRRAFPTPAQLVEVGEDELNKSLVGFSSYAPNVYRAAKRVVSGELVLDTLKRMPYAEAKKELMQLHGIGPKIADCILLFSLGKLDAFPIDRWIGRALVEWYFPGQKTPASHELPTWAKLFQEHFGSYAGYANQYLFHGQRKEQMQG